MWRKRIKKVLLVVLSVITLFVTGATVLTMAYQQEVIQLFIRQANKLIKTPVETENIKMSVWSNFPDLTLHFSQVKVNGSLEASPLVAASEIGISLSILDLLAGDYKIKDLTMDNGFVHLMLNEEGDNNYTIFHKQNSQSSDSASFKFELENVTLKDIELIYKDSSRQHEYQIFAEDLEANLRVENNIYTAKIRGPVDSKGFWLEEQGYLANKELNVDLELSYNHPGQFLNIYPSVIAINNADFVVEGDYSISDYDVNLIFRGENSDINTIISLLPQENADKLNTYRSKGDIYFSGLLKGNVEGENIPAVKIDFGCTDATFYHPKYNQKVENVSMAGSYTNGSQQNLTSSELTLKKVSGEFENRSFGGDISIKNFDNYYLDFNLKGAVDVNSALKFYPIENIREATGLIDFDISFRGFMNHLKNSKSIERTVSSGDINLRNLYLELADVKLPLKDLNGNFRFKSNDLAISNFSGSVGTSEFLLNGFFKDVLAYLFDNSEKINVEADLYSAYMNVDELLSGNLTGSKETFEQKYSFNISPKLDLDFKCDIKKLKFRKFRGNDITGHLNIKRQVAYSKNISVSTLGGKLSVDGMVDARNDDNIEVLMNSHLEGIHMDSLFYVFENFNQNFLEDRHLKGKIFSDMNTYLAFDRNIKLKSEKLSSDISISIVNGELNNFEPMQGLSAYVDENSLSRLRFSELKNEIKIKDQTIFLPEMKVVSNVNQIKVSGTHTFDQLIQYHLMVPIKNYKRKNSDEAFGSIEEDHSGNLNLFLKIVGSTDDYKVVYDTRAVTDKIKQDIKKEGEELKAAFQNKGKEKKKVVEINEDEYLEF